MAIYKCLQCGVTIDTQYLTATLLHHFINCVIPNTKSFSNFADQYEGVWGMPTATLSYEALQLDQDGNIVEGAYRLKLQGNFKQHIEPIVKFIKATIPSSDRTYDPPTYEWFYHEKWHDFVKQALSGTRFSVTYTVTKEAFTELKRKQQEWAKQAGQAFATRQVPVEEDLELFGTLLAATNYLNGNDYKNWTREQATSAYKKAIRFYHPDLHPERAEEASSLNEVWARLKEGYYIK